MSEITQSDQEKLERREQDERELCEQIGIPYLVARGMWKQVARGHEDIGLGDVFYLLWLGKQAGLPPGPNWFSLIPPTEKDKERGRTGFSVCFRLDAALYILTHHDDVEDYDWMWTDGKGNEYDRDHEPSFPGKVQGDKTVYEIDHDMTCTVRAKMKRFQDWKTMTLRYREWKKGYYGLWQTMPARMLWKQSVKEFVRAYLGASLPWEDESPIHEETRVVTPAPPALTPGTPLPPPVAFSIPGPSLAEPPVTVAKVQSQLEELREPVTPEQRIALDETVDRQREAPAAEPSAAAAP